MPEPGVFIVDDVAFLDPEHATPSPTKSIAANPQGILSGNADRFPDAPPGSLPRWRKLGLQFMFLGLEALDDEGLKRFRKRTMFRGGMKALEIARRLGITAAVNIIAEPSWDERQFETVRRWAISVPEIVHLTVATPYPGTETWLAEASQLTTRDYRLFDIQHAVLPTRLPLERFYQELVRTQQVLNRKHLGWAGQCRALLSDRPTVEPGPKPIFSECCGSSIPSSIPHGNLPIIIARSNTKSSCPSVAGTCRPKTTLRPSAGNNHASRERGNS